MLRVTEAQMDWVETVSYTHLDVYKRQCLSCALIVLCLACVPVLAQNVSLPESIGRELGERYSDYALLAADDALAAGTPGEFAVIALTKDGESVLTVFRRLGEELYALALKSKTANSPGVPAASASSAASLSLIHI